MRIFQEVEKSFISLGFSPDPEPLNRTILRSFAAILLADILLFVRFFQGADSAQHRIESIYIITTATGVLLSFASTIFIKQKLFSFFTSCDAFLNESTFNLEEFYC